MANVRVILRRTIREGVRAARDARHPEEACGLLFGHVTRSEEDSDLVSIIPQVFVECENVLHSPSAFEIDPVEQYRHVTSHKGLSLVGIVHTHPGAQFLSASDERFMLGISMLSKACWVIAGTGKDGNELDFGAYIVEGSNITRVAVVHSPA